MGVTIIAAAPSAKNKAKARDQEMHQTRKGSPWYFGMKTHIGVNAESGLVHTATGTAADVPNLLCTAAMRLAVIVLRTPRKARRHDG